MIRPEFQLSKIEILADEQEQLENLIETNGFHQSTFELVRDHYKNEIDKLNLELEEL